MPPTDSELIDAWITLKLLHGQAIAGEVLHRRFDTPTVCTQAQRMIEVVLEERLGSGYAEVLWDALDERNADSHA